MPCAVGAETSSYLSSGKDALESGGSVESELPRAKDVDDEDDADALAAEAEDCFCEPDIGYDGEIVFDCADFTFVAPEVQRQNARVAAALSNRSMTSEQCGKSESHNAECYSAEELNLKAVKVDNMSQLPGFALESNTESGQEVHRRNLKPTGDERRVLENYDSHVDSDDSSNGVAVTNGRYLKKRDSSTNNTDKKLLSQTKISGELSQTMNLNNVNGNNFSTGSTKLRCLASTEILKCSTSDVIPVAVETRNEMIATTPSVSKDKTWENDYRCSSVGVDGSVLTNLQQTDETAWEPRTIVIDKSKTFPMYAAPNVPEGYQISSVKDSSEPRTIDGSELQSQTTVARGEITVQTTDQLSNETREKLSSESFLSDRSMCSRFYPSLPNSCDTVNASTLSSADTGEEKLTFISNESAQIKSDHVLPTSRNSDSNSECGRKLLYHLVRHAPPAAGDDCTGALDSCRKTVDSNESKPMLNISEQQTFRAAEKAEKHSTNTSFTVELQRHLSKWQHQHPKDSGAPLEKSTAATPCDSDAGLSSPTKNPSCFNSVSASDVNGTKEVKDRKSSVNSSSGQSNSSLPPTTGSLVIATGSNTRSVANGSNSSAVANNKGLNKTEVVFTMDQILNAKSGLRRTARSESSSAEVSHNQAFYRSQNPQSSVKENKDSASSVTSTTLSSQDHVKVPTSPKASDGGVCSSENNIPAPPSLLAFVGNHVEKKTGPLSGRIVTEGRRNKLVKKPQQQQEMNSRDDLLTAIRNAGGKPMKVELLLCL